MTDKPPQDIVLSGYLYKWTNYIKGYQKHWFLLENGNLCSYKSKADAQNACKGSISVKGATIASITPTSFTVSNHGGHVFYLRAQDMEEARIWVKSLKQAARLGEEKEEDDDEVKALSPNAQIEIDSIVKEINDKIQELKSCKEVVLKHWNALQQILLYSDEEQFRLNAISKKDIEVKATLFRVTASAMVNKMCELEEYVESNWGKLKTQWNILNKQINRLEIAVHVLAKQQAQMEKINDGENVILSDNEDEEYFDAMCSVDRTHVGQATRKKKIVKEECKGNKIAKSGKVRRTKVPDKPESPLSLWSVIKNFIGTDLTRISLPVDFSEPLSFLQRLTEELEYSEILDEASACTDSCLQLAHVAAFIVSTYSSTAIRITKPFNPLLYETYEFDRMEDLGWRSIAEQVSHHPPISAFHCEGKKWSLWKDVKVKSRMKGNHLKVNPEGTTNLLFHESQNLCTWQLDITTIINNIIIGKLWIDNRGEIQITNNRGDVCKLDFFPYTTRTSKRVDGFVKNEKGETKWILKGEWDQRVELIQSGTPNPSEVSIKSPGTSIDTGSKCILWEVNPQNPGCENFYFFSQFACQLNESEDGTAPTDSRLRTDQRFMENGLWEEANKEKVRLENKQREARRQRELEVQQNSALNMEDPIWFKKVKDEKTDREVYVFGHEYWECKEKNDWSRCPQLF